VHSKGNNYTSEKAAYKMGDLCQFFIWRGLISRIYKKLKKLKSKRTKSTINKWAKELKRSTNKYMKNFQHL
jgi:hypothetical protein